MQEKQRTAGISLLTGAIPTRESVLQVSAASLVDALSTQRIPHLLGDKTALLTAMLGSLTAHPLLLGSSVQNLLLAVLEHFFPNTLHFPNCIVLHRRGGRAY